MNIHLFKSCSFVFATSLANQRRLHSGLLSELYIWLHSSEIARSRTSRILHTSRRQTSMQSICDRCPIPSKATRFRFFLWRFSGMREGRENSAWTVGASGMPHETRAEELCRKQCAPRDTRPPRFRRTSSGELSSSAAAKQALASFSPGNGVSTRFSAQPVAGPTMSPNG